MQVAQTRLGIACFGGCGVNNALLLLNSLDPDAHPHLVFFVANTDARQLELFFGEHAHVESNLAKWLQKPQQLIVQQLGYEVTKGRGAGGKPSVGEKALKENSAEIEKFLQSLDALLIVAGLGGGSGTGAVPIVATMAKKLCIPTLAITTLPLAFEGRTNKADKALAAIKAATPTVVVFNQKASNKEKLFSAIWDEINASCLKPMLEVLREIIQEVGEGINLDLADWIAALEEGNDVYFACADVSEDETVGSDELEHIVDVLAANPYQDDAFLHHARVLLLWFRGPWKLSETEAVANGIKKRIHGEETAPIEIHCGVFQNTRDEGKWVGMVAVSAVSVAHNEDSVIPLVETVNGSSASVPQWATLTRHVDGQRVELAVLKSQRNEWLALERTPAKGTRDAEFEKRKRSLEALRLAIKDTEPMGRMPDLPKWAQSDEDVSANGSSNGHRAENGEEKRSDEQKWVPNFFRRREKESVSERRVQRRIQ